MHASEIEELKRRVEDSASEDEDELMARVRKALED
jgi:hypothetical protein